MLNMKNNFYVYIYWRLDTNEPFYIGKGHGNRWKDTSDRNDHFNNILNKISVAVEIFEDNLTEEQALDIECWLINELVFKYGFSIDIPNNRGYSNYCNLVNQTWGGEGSSGCNHWERKTEEEIVKWKDKIRDGKIGKNNPMFGKSPRDFMTEEDWNKKIEKVTGKNNYRAKCVICLTTNEIFYSMADACKKYNLNSSHLSGCCKGTRNYHGKLEDGRKLIWRYLTWKHNKKYRVKTNK